uniref:hypothetical protein n=1 Tax=Klebsiella sp. TaxID=576 RepID=UPI00258CEDA0|nr:hypothetical protein [Klebsiella sp.]
MNLENLKSKLKPQLEKFELVGEVVYIQRPSASDLPKCDTIASTLIYCVKDENGDPIFADTDIDGRINVGSIDFIHQKTLFDAIQKIAEVSDVVDEIEKK